MIAPVTAAAAVAAYNANHAIPPVLVADTVANLLAYLAGLQTLKSAGKLSSVTATGASNMVTASQAQALAGLPHFSVAAGGAVAVQDSANNLLSAAYVGGLAIATSVRLSGRNVVSASQATTLAALRAFSLEGGATLAVQDTAANLSLPTNAAGLSKATAVTLVGGASINAVDMSSAMYLVGLRGFSLASGAGLDVRGSASDLLSPAHARAVAMATSVTLVGHAVVDVAQAIALTGLHGFRVYPGPTSSLAISDTAANFLAQLDRLQSAVANIASVSLDTNPVGSLAITYSQYISDGTILGRINGSYGLVVAGVPAVAVSTLLVDQHVTRFTVVGASVAQALTFAGYPKITGIDIVDTAAHVIANLSALNASAKVSSLQVDGSGTPTIDFTWLRKPVTISLGIDAASATLGLNHPSLTFIGTVDHLSLGSGGGAINYRLEPTSGIETVTNFQYFRDRLKIDLAGAQNSMLKATDTTVNGVHAISLYSSADPYHGIVLLGETTGQTAADLLAHHTTFAGGFAFIT